MPLSKMPLSKMPLSERRQRPAAFRRADTRSTPRYDVPDFRIVLHARSPHVGPGEVLTIGGEQIPTLRVSASDLAYSYSISFERVFQRLSGMHRMFLELDGSFVWTGRSDGRDWQVEGSLLDRDGRLLFVEVWGQCPSAAFDEFLTELGWPDTPVMIQLVRHAIYIDETDFRRLQCWPSNG